MVTASLSSVVLSSVRQQLPVDLFTKDILDLVVDWDIFYLILLIFCLSLFLPWKQIQYQVYLPADITSRRTAICWSFECMTPIYWKWKPLAASSTIRWVTTSLHPFTGMIIGVQFPQKCYSSFLCLLCSWADRLTLVHSSMLSSHIFLWWRHLLLPSRVSSLALQGAFSCPPVCLLLPTRVPSLALQDAFSCPPGCILLPNRVPALAHQGAFSCPPVCLLLPSRVPSLALQDAFSCPPGCLLLPSRVHSLALQDAFSCPPVCLLLPTRVPSLALQDAFSCPPGCLLLPSRVHSLALQDAFSCPPVCLLLPTRVHSLALQDAFSCPPGCLLLPTRVPCMMVFEVVLTEAEWWPNQECFLARESIVVSLLCALCKKWKGATITTMYTKHSFFH